MVIPLAGQAGTSANYSLAPDTLDHGGLRGTSASYTADFSASPGGAGASASFTTRTGFAGQLRDVIATDLMASPLTVNEGSTRQLSATARFDDATTAALAATSVAWSVQSGPIASISTGGLATAATVYQNTTAVARGTYQGVAGTLNLSVLESIPDNFGAYAADAIDDAWQVQYFGQPPNANAGPLADPDRDGQTNAFEYTAGLIPTDANSVFRLRLEAVPAQPGQKRVIFSPRLTDRTYVVKAKPSLLTGTFTALGSSSFTDNAQERTVTDLNASGATKFYQVEITKP